MENAITFPNRHGEHLAGLLYKPDKPTDKGIILAHCFTCSKHIGVIRKTCCRLAKDGFLVLRFDFSGNGESEGKFEEATYTKERDDLDVAIAYMFAQGITKLGMLGHSMGAAVSIIQSARDERINTLCVIGPPAHAACVERLFPEEKKKEIEEQGKSCVDIMGRPFTITKAFVEDARKYSLKDSVKKFTKPFCLIHGSKDELLPVEDAKQLFEAASEPKELHIIEGADHMFSKHLKEVEDLASVWFAKTLI